MIFPYGERSGRYFYNAARVVDTNGRHLGTYRKTHIPAYFPDEQAGGTGSYEKFYFTPGDALPVFDRRRRTRSASRSATTGSIPKASRALALTGAEIVAMPICFSTYSEPTHRASIWEVPLRARAYENGVFVLAVNRVGVEKAAAITSARA